MYFFVNICTITSQNDIFKVVFIPKSSNGYFISKIREVCAMSQLKFNQQITIKKCKEPLYDSGLYSNVISVLRIRRTRYVSC
jgi:hypothetical protein